MKLQVIQGRKHISKKRVLIVGLIASLLTGCSVGPKYVRPKVKSPDVFRGTA